jgi:hypothetical protein
LNIWKMLSAEAVAGVRRHGRDVLPEHVDAAGLRRDDPADQVEQRRLAGARRAEQQNAFAAPDSQTFDRQAETVRTGPAERNRLGADGGGG